MNQFYKTSLLIIAAINFCVCSAFCSETFIGPTIRSNRTVDAHGISSTVMELSPRHHRFLQSYTAFLPPHYESAIKWRGEFLLQRLNYKNVPNNHNYLIPQLTTAISYKRLKQVWLFDSYNFDIYASYSWGKLLKTEGMRLTPFCGWGIQGGIEKRVPFFYTMLGANVLCDVGKYHRRGLKNITFAGPGMSFFLEQPIGRSLRIKNEATFRVPFKHYNASLEWKPNEKHSFAVFGNRTVCKLSNQNTSTKNIGVEWVIKLPVVKKKHNPCVDTTLISEDLKTWAICSHSFYPQVVPYAQPIYRKKKDNREQIQLLVVFDQPLEVIQIEEPKEPPPETYTEMIDRWIAYMNSGVEAFVITTVIYNILYPRE